MNILHLSETPLSGAPYRLMSIQQKEGHNARLINHRVQYSAFSNMVYPHDILLQYDPSHPKKRIPLFSKDEIFDLFHNADIIHCHNFFTDQFIFRYFPELVKYLSTKKVVLQVHSPRDSLKNVNQHLRDPRIDVKLVIAQFQERQYSECTVVPNAIDIEHPLYRNVYNKENPVPHIVYSPSNTFLKGWNNKGYKEVMATLNLIPGPHVATYDVILDTPHYQCIERKQVGDIAIDEFMTGSYHLCTLEGLSHGQLVFGRLDDRTQRVVKELLQVDEFPVINVTKKTFEEKLSFFLYHPEQIKTYQEKARQFMETHWNARVLNEHYNRAYKI